MALKPKTLKRTVSFWRLVNAKDSKPVPEIDWRALQSRLLIESEDNGKIDSRRIADKDVSAAVWSVDTPDPDFLACPDIDDLVGDLDRELIVGMVVSTDRDYLPSQRMPDGTQKPLPVDDGGIPAVNSFVWFLPFGNIFALMKEDLTAISAPMIGTWISSILRSRGMLNGQSQSLRAVPVIDEESRKRLNNASAMRSVFLSGEVSHNSAGLLSDLLHGGPDLHGSYALQIKLVPKRHGAPIENFNRDKGRLLDWFEDVFGTLSGEAEGGGLRSAKVKLEGPDTPPTEFDIMQYRLTRKRQVEIGSENAPDAKHATLEPLAAFRELYLAAVEDYDDLLRLRHTDAV